MNDVDVTQEKKYIDVLETVESVDGDGNTTIVLTDGAFDITTIEVSNPQYITAQEILNQVVAVDSEDVNITEIGIAGRDGVDGDKHFEQEFAPAASVNVMHNLNKFPAVTVIDSAGTEIIGDVFHISNNQLIVSFSAPFGGKVICN